MVQTPAMGIEVAGRQGWEELTSRQRRAIIVGGTVTTIWQLAMLWDLRKRPADQIRGPKWRWVLASFVRPFGQIAYYLWGRRPTGLDDTDS
jgi:hypothetical protein